MTSEVPSARAQLRAWQEAPGQRFRIFRLGDGFQIISEESGVCLGARGSESDVQLIAARCASDPSQIFQIASEQNRPPVFPQGGPASRILSIDGTLARLVANYR